MQQDGPIIRKAVAMGGFLPFFYRELVEPETAFVAKVCYSHCLLEDYADKMLNTVVERTVRNLAVEVKNAEEERESK